MITGADVGDDFDGLLASRSHQEVDFEGDPVGVDGLPGGKQRQNHQVMEAAGDGLPLSIESGRWFNVSVEQVIGDHRVKPEADSLRSFGDVDQDAIGDGLGTRVGVNDVPAFIFIHYRNQLASEGTAFQTDYENSL